MLLMGKSQQWWESSKVLHWLPQFSQRNRKESQWGRLRVGDKVWEFGRRDGVILENGVSFDC